jgi:hypothetical protein
VKRPREHVVQWAGVKPAGRALEKLVRSYDLDPSRLLDACRETLAYDHPGAIAAALQAIAADGELEVVRVKNRLEPHPNFWELREGGEGIAKIEFRHFFHPSLMMLYRPLSASIKHIPKNSNAHPRPPPPTLKHILHSSPLLPSLGCGWSLR